MLSPHHRLETGNNISTVGLTRAQKMFMFRTSDYGSEHHLLDCEHHLIWIYTFRGIYCLLSSGLVL